MKKITVYEIYKFDSLDRPYGKIGKQFKSDEEAKLVIEALKLEIEHEEGRAALDNYHFVVAPKEIEVCETIEEYNAKLEEGFSDTKKFLMRDFENENEKERV